MELIANEKISLDPRTERTRQTLQMALVQLLNEMEFEKISVQSIASAAGVNRVTFYDHYTDKFTLLNAMVAARFNDLLQRRNVAFDSSCNAALEAIIQAVCDFLAEAPGDRSRSQSTLEPHLEVAVIAVLQEMLLVGMKAHPSKLAIPVEMLASSVSWAIFGAAREWARTAARCPSGEIINTIVVLISPLLSHFV